MTIKPIRIDKYPRAASESGEMEARVTQSESYENKRPPIGPSGSVEAVTFRMDQTGPGPRVFQPSLGRSRRDSGILNREWPLSPPLVMRLRDGMAIPYPNLPSRAA